MKPSKIMAVLTLAFGLTGLVVCGLWGVLEPRRFLAAYHTGWLLAMTIPIGALFILLFADTVGSTWHLSVKPILRGMVNTLPFLILGSIPLYFNLSGIFPWADPTTTEGRDIVVSRGAFHSTLSFIIRTSIYDLILVALVLASRGRGETGRFKLAPLGLIAFGFATTFFSFDWVMSTLPHWSSTIFGVYFFNGSVVAALSVLLFIASRDQALRAQVSLIHDLSKYLYVMMLFWGHVAFLQFLLIWFANIPEETHYFHLRSHGGYGAWTAVLWALHVVVPLFVFMSAPMKKAPKAALVFAIMLFAAHIMDVFSMSYPNHFAVFAVRPVDLLAMTAWVLIFSGLFSLFLRSAKPGGVTRA